MALSVHLPEIDVRLDHFKSYDVTANFFLPPHTFTMRLFDTDPIKLRETTVPLSPLVIYNDQDFVLAGVILDQELHEDDSVTIRGTDHTYKLDGILDPANAVPRDTLLLDVIKRQVAPFGFDTINADNNEMRTFQCSQAPSVSPAAPADTWKVGKEKIRAENAWGFLNKVAAKYGYFIQPGISGASLAVVKPEYNQAPTYTIRRLASKPQGNNVLSRSVSRGYRGVPTYVQGVSRSGDSREAQIGNKVSAQLKSQIEAHEELRAILGSRAVYDKFDFKAGAVVPGLLEGGKQLVYNPVFVSDQYTADGYELANRVNREFIDYFKNTLVGRYTVPFHRSPEGASYTVDTMAHVIDDVGGLDENLYIAERTFSLAGNEETTRLTTIRAQSYTL